MFTTFDTYTDTPAPLAPMVSETVNLGALTVPVTPDTADPITEAREAWDRIKTNSKMMREDWRKVGEALLIGRNLFTTANGGLNKKGFGQWCRDNGFGDIDQRRRTDAMWLAENWDSIHHTVVDSDFNHPTHIRAAYNEALDTKPSAPVGTQAPTPAIFTPRPRPTEGTSTSAPTEAPTATDDDGETPPWNDDTPAPSTPTATESTTVAVEPPEAESEDNVGIYDGQPNEDLEVADQVNNLIGIRHEVTSDLFFKDFLKSVNADYFVGVARKKLIDELRSGRAAPDALENARLAMRAEQERMREDIEEKLNDIGTKAMASFLKQTENNRLLKDESSSKLLQRALDHKSSTPAERKIAIRALQARK